MINRNDLIETLKIDPTDGRLVDSDCKYRTIPLVDDVLFNELISGVILVEVEEGILMIPYKNLLGNPQDGYEQLDINKAKLATNRELDYIRNGINKTSSYNLNFIEDYNKKKENMNLAKLPYYGFIKDLDYTDGNLRWCLKNNFAIIKMLENLNIETFKKIDNKMLLALLTNVDLDDGDWSELYLINNNKLILVEGRYECELEAIDIEDYTERQLQNAFANIIGDFNNKISFMKEFEFESLKEKK